MALCEGCGASSPDAGASPWTCAYCGRANRASAPGVQAANPGSMWSKGGVARSGPVDVPEILRRYADEDGFFFGDTIPPKKLLNAAIACEVEQREVLALVDLTVFGSAKLCILFTRSGIHYRNDWSGKQSGTWFKPYAELEVTDGGSYEIALGGGGFVNVAGSTLKKPKIIEILQAVAG